MKNKRGGGAVERLATFIVDKRNRFFCKTPEMRNIPGVLY